MSRTTVTRWSVAILVGMTLLLSGISSAWAVPHTVSGPHPYDPDWPDVWLIVAQKCAACHRFGGERVDFTRYETLISARVEGMPVVVPGNPEDSLLFQYVDWNVRAQVDCPSPDQPMMPPERSEWLTAGQLEQLRRWIANGARLYCDPRSANRPRPLIETDYPSARQCAPCHPKQYEEWSRSMHAYAQQSPIFEAFNLTMLERTGGTLGTFCTRCHTPLGTALGENGSCRNVHRSRLSLEGVTCITCHRRPKASYKASGRVAITPGSLHETCMYGPFEDAVSADQQAHPSKSQPYLKSSQFCGECHDVTIPSGIRLEEAFSEWNHSPAAARGITCQQCHMGPVQGVPIAEDQRPWGRAAVVPGVPPERIPLRRLSDHTFAGPDYSLLPDTEFPHKLDWMYEQDYRDSASLTPYQQRTLLELRHRNRASLRKASEKRYELLGNSARLQVHHPRVLAAGSRSAIEVCVKNLISGHSLPTGFTAERQVWVSVQLCDPRGRVVFSSGDLDHNGDLRDDHSHEVLTGKAAADLHLLNFQNKFVALTNKGTERAVVLSVNRHLTPLNVLRPATGIPASFGRPASFRIAKGSLAPESQRRRRYPIVLPNCPGTYRVNVQLHFRHLPPTLLDHIGTPHLKHLLEVVRMDHYEGTINVTP